ncbi:hypothetical protein EXS66_01575 [Candidatus Saccharibacteria bacterium]|nr:hypothetical protein [Candidatus Saccharibacteria bacterium]
MKPQDNDFPIDQIKSDNQVVPGVPIDSHPQPPGGVSFQPQTSPQQPLPEWQQAAQVDASMIKPQDMTLSVESNVPLDPTLAMPGTPTPGSFASPPESTVPFDSTPAPLNVPTADSITTPTPDAPDTYNASTVNDAIQQPPIAPSSPEPADIMGGETPGGTLPADMPGADQVTAGLAPTQPNYSQPGTLPGADQLGPGAVGLDAPNMMGSYGPPPRKSGKLLFIIVGVVLGLALIGGGIFYFTVVAKKQNENVTPTPTPQPEPAPVPAPTSGPATPPEGYETITKQCYTFALIVPNAIPKDENCLFAKTTFGKKLISTIAVDTKTDSYQKIDDYLTVVGESRTLVSSEPIKLDNLDATQVIYKAPDGRTYSLVALLIVSKTYQQDGKAVTVVAVTTSYQDEFDISVTKNVIDTWRWQ